MTQSIRLLAALLLGLSSLGSLSCGHEVSGEDDSCVYAEDGVCDDASYQASITAACQEGTDSTDCNRSGICEDTCIWSEDGDCDDGGAGSVTNETR